MMTCTECLELVAVADIEDLAASHAIVRHTHDCADCARVIDDVRASTRHAADHLAAIPPNGSPTLVARRAIAEAGIRRERGRRLRLVGYPLGAALLSVALMLASSRVDPSRWLDRMRGREMRAVALRCLTGPDALDLVRPYGTTRVRISMRRGSRVMNIVGPRADVRTIVNALAHLDAPAPNGACASR